MFVPSPRPLRAETLSLILAAVLLSLVALLYATDRRLGLYHFASTRCRFHAIPVAVSVLYHNRPHDYTANRSLAMGFQNTERELDHQLRESIQRRDDNPGTYFWVADDRGLADYAIASFSLFGPKTRSLSKFYFVLLAGTLALFVAGYRRSPAALLLPTFVLLGWLALAQVLLYPTPFPNGQGQWAEQIPLYESRMFDVLALVAVLHLGLLAAGPQAGRAAWVTAVPQAAFLVFLYHARSSLGWQYLALFTLIGVRLVWWAVAFRLVAQGSRPVKADVLRPLFVALLLGGSLVGLKQYQRLVYFPGYLAEHGNRTFWHNALMGLAYHPALRDDLGMPLCDDRTTAEFVLRKMAERDPGLDRSKWNEVAAMNSLGNHNAFDWNAYEVVGRDVYLELWRDRPRDMAACYGFYKPLEAGRLAARLAKRVALVSWAGRGWEFLAGLGLVVVAAVGVAAVARRDERVRSELLPVAGVAASLLPFGLIPGIAFYPAITTTACFYLLSATAAGLLAVRVASRRKGAV